MSKTISVVFRALDTKKQTDFINFNFSLIEKSSKEAMKLPNDSSAKSPELNKIVK